MKKFNKRPSVGTIITYTDEEESFDSIVVSRSKRAILAAMDGEQLNNLQIKEVTIAEFILVVPVAIEKASNQTPALGEPVVLYWPVFHKTFKATGKGVPTHLLLTGWSEDARYDLSIIGDNPEVKFPVLVEVDSYQEEEQPCSRMGMRFDIPDHSRFHQCWFDFKCLWSCIR